MGCKSGKVAEPVASISAENTLLAPRKVDHQAEAAKDPADVQSDEVTSRPATFDGRWSGGAVNNRQSGGVINGQCLTLADGFSSSILQVRIDKRAGIIKVCKGGNYSTGELKDNGRLIIWSNGEVWTRYHVCSAFYEHEGFLDGPDLLTQTMTPEEAKCKAASMPECIGFTYSEAAPALISSGMPVRTHFKSKWNIGKTVGRWTSFKKEEVACAVGDSVMAVFTPNGRRYPAKISSISHDNAITVDWVDGGRTHRTLPQSKVFKDGCAPSAVQASATAAAEAAHDCNKMASQDCQKDIEKSALAGLPRGCGWHRFLEEEPSTLTDDKGAGPAAEPMQRGNTSQSSTRPSTLSNDATELPQAEGKGNCKCVADLLIRPPPPPTKQQRTGCCC